MLKRVLAFDFGASNGRAILGSYDGSKISIEEIHRFENTPIIIGNHMHWNLPELFNEIKKAMVIAEGCGEYHSIGIDTWGVDYGIINRKGELVSNPRHYRDVRTAGMIDEVDKIISRDKLYTLTGNQLMEINTLFQLYSEYLANGIDFYKDKTILMMPDLFNYLLTGVKRAEKTIASTTQIFDPYNKKWNEYIIRKLGICKELFPEIVASGTEIGLIKEELAEELNIERKVVIAVCEHDTASAVAAVPSKKDFLFLSCGTWSLFGTELSEPLINEKTLAYNLTNETGINNTTRLLKNIKGLWLIQETKRQFAREGKNYDYNAFEILADEAMEFSCFIDVDAEEFGQLGDIPSRIRRYAENTRQNAPKSHGEVIRCIYEGLAFQYRNTYEQICECTQKKYNVLHLVGGGSKSTLLCQMTANALGIEVVAGPAEATAIGNVLVQLMVQGEINSIEQGREIVEKSFGTKRYFPVAKDLWNKKYMKYKEITQIK